MFYGIIFSTLAKNICNFRIFSIKFNFKVSPATNYNIYLNTTKNGPLDLRPKTVPVYFFAGGKVLVHMYEIHNTFVFFFKFFNYFRPATSKKRIQAVSAFWT